MLDKIIHFSIHNKLVVGIFVLALIAGGSYSLSQLPIDAVPDITNNQVQIITTSPSLAAQEVERLVTFPVETALATIPHTEEIRSISRFGLSVITVVFKDNIDVYWARQQVSERLQSAVSQIPPGAGKPELAPVTTGLGEIYQYVLHTRPGYEKQYPPMELRSIQDWIVRRQLLGTEGVADVSSFGGFLKQYEIAVDPLKLRSAGITISDLFTALEKNNQNTGGAYIDKKPNAYFVRSEGLIGSIKDIENIRVRETAAGLPLLIRDIAKVQLGSAVRYGAMTRNAEGEVVGGLVLMLKGANASKVIGNVKERVAQISKTLPEGVVIEPFLDRTKLVNKAIHTVSTNLIEGALIVIFVLILMLGNLRAGLVVASVIPLSMLFAVTMMHLFGVSGNLMSLGAIDFGLIVDGAVIIVEATLHHLGARKLGRKLSQSEMDEEVYQSASKIRSSAAFGEIIILIVYLPILALVGIEGKMFRPMAQTVSFAILGAFILSLTYVPMISALFLNKNTEMKPGISDKIMSFFHRIYQPALAFALRQKALVIGISMVLLTGALWLFLNMGGEFIPQLDEGDFAIELRVLTGSSLSETVDATRKAAGILKKHFPDEVVEVVGKIGSSEIPTDPMPVEAGDVMVILNEKSMWKKAGTREQLAAQMQEVLTNSIPGVTFGFQQPIQMRFNELISGVKQDVAVKIFGEDLDILASQAQKIGRIAGTVKGAEDVYIESVSGLPQIVVTFDRARMATFGINIEDANRTLNTAFAGGSAGLVYEGEKRFELVVRLDHASRQDIADVRGLFVTNDEGQQVPMSQIAEVAMVTGANQIQREDARRRAIVAFNVRGRDVETVVAELQTELDQQLKLPTGYYIQFGGQFQNLKEASSRLGIAVPAALTLIFLLLYFSFRSLRQSILILSAIPLSAIGGVLALWLRGMPFSISAGIGFIALFGVAVLNGIVLIAEFNFLRKNGLHDLREVIIQGTETRLRPVLMTALVASLGFLPMALSHSSGAEVQRPLATVVIGGLVSATLLTLLVLPVLYWIVERRFGKIPVKAAGLLLFPLLLPFHSKAQNVQPQKRTLAQVITEASSQNLQIRSGTYLIESRQALRGTAAEVARTEVSWLAGQYNSRAFDNQFNIAQPIPNPAVIARRKQLLNAQADQAQLRQEVTKAELVRQAKQLYYKQLYVKNRQKILEQDSARADRFAAAAALRLRTGEANQLEETVARSEQSEIRTRLARNRADLKNLEKQLQLLTHNALPVTAAEDTLTRRSLPALVVDYSGITNPYLRLAAQEVVLENKSAAMQRAAYIPDFTVGYFNQSLTGFHMNGDREVFYGPGKRFQGFQVGVSLPVFNGATKAKVKAAEAGARAAASQAEYARMQAGTQFQQAVLTYQTEEENLRIYEQATLSLADNILQTATKGYEAGEIGYLEFSQAMSRAFQIRHTYLDLLDALNQSAIDIEFLLDKQ